VTKRVKYPRTYHLPFSLGVTSDDKVLKNTGAFIEKEVVITIKMDGESTTLYKDGFHARSIDSRHHPSRDWLARFHSTIAHEIPDGYRICGENLYARHSVVYTDLPSYFMGFSVWNGDVSLNWDDTVEFFELLGIVSVPVIYRGQFDEQYLIDLGKNFDTVNNEGFVVRLASAFNYQDFGTSVAKWVREKHVQTGEHWMHSAVLPNGLMRV
jgi:hypothetical protein